MLFMWPRSFESFRVDEQVSLLWSFAVLSLPPPSLEVEGRLQAREAANLCWSMAIFERHSKALLIRCGKILEEGALEVHLNQYHLAHMAYQLEAAGREPFESFLRAS